MLPRENGVAKATDDDTHCLSSSGVPPKEASRNRCLKSGQSDEKASRSALVWLLIEPKRTFAKLNSLSVWEIEHSHLNRPRMSPSSSADQCDWKYSLQSAEQTKRVLKESYG